MTAEATGSSSKLSVSVAVVTYERHAEFERLLESLLDTNGSFDQLVIVDDSDEDRTEQHVGEYGSAFEAQGTRVTYRRRNADDGIPGARNVAIEMADGDVICFLDDDTVVVSGWVDAIREGYANHDVAAVGGPAIVTDEDLEPTHPIRETEAGLNTVTPYGEIRVAADRWVPPEPTETDLLEGANMSFRTEVIREIGGFDVNYRGMAFCEEIDVMTRLRQRGYRILYHPDAFVYHTASGRGGSREARMSAEEYYWVGRNMIRYRWKNHRDTFRRGLLRLLLSTPYPPGPVWKQLGAVVVKRDRSKLGYLRGYVDGLRKERG